MTKRKGLLSTLETAAMAKAGAAAKPVATARPSATESGETTTTGIHLPADVLALAKAVAHVRAKRDGGRASVSALFVELVRRHEDELRKEAGAAFDFFQDR